jgi:glutamine cyclotransferase
MKLHSILLLAALLLSISPAHSVEEFEARVVEKIPHGREDYVQGLEIHQNRLYQGTGRYGHSKLQVFELAGGALLEQQALPAELFGEGITLFQNRIIQLTWRENKALVYRLADLELIEEFPLPGEGWGLTNDGEQLIYSDGSDQLHFISAPDWQIVRSLSVRLQGRPVQYLNELEWTPDYLLANVYGRDWILMIEADSGEVIGRIDLTGLLPRQERRSGTGVLNGIARDPATGALWVTGKNWPWIYQIELQPKRR